MSAFFVKTRAKDKVPIHTKTLHLFPHTCLSNEAMMSQGAISQFNRSIY